jgi:hypothetical protein
VVGPPGQEVDGKVRVGPIEDFQRFIEILALKGQNHQNIHVRIRRGVAISIGAEQDYPLRLEVLDDAVAEVPDGLFVYNDEF